MLARTSRVTRSAYMFIGWIWLTRCRRETETVILGSVCFLFMQRWWRRRCNN